MMVRFFRTDQRTHERTVCDCYACRENCRYIPGYLLPEDIVRISETMRKRNIFTGGRFRASPGALVFADGHAFRIHTIVPALTTTGCTFFLPTGHCLIHDVSPFGCAFFDAHQSPELSDEISTAGLKILLKCQNNPKTPEEKLYTESWNWLYRRGLVSDAPEELRKRMDLAQTPQWE